MALLLNEMDDRRKAAFTFAQDATKQLITLATGLIALSITFYYQFAQLAGPVSRALMAFSWAFYLASVVMGLITLLALTGSLEPASPTGTSQPQPSPSIRGSNVTRPAGAQIILFLIGLLLTVAAGIIGIAYPLSPPPPAPST